MPKPKQKRNRLITPKQFVHGMMASALKHAKGDKKLAGKLLVAFATGLNGGPMPMGR